MELPPLLKKRLDDVICHHQHRTLKERRGVDFTSNDYLGFAQDRSLLEIFKKDISHLTHLGSSGSRLLRGNLEIFGILERELAQFSNREAGLFFSTGFQCNLSLYSALLTRQDLVFSDEYNHASIIDGIRLSRSQCEVYPHSNVQSLSKVLEKYKDFKGLKVIATESIFSMEGDRAPLKELVSLAKEYEALIVVDEAHATGLMGSGLVQENNLERDVFATVHTGGKALGASGAWVASDSDFKDFLINFSRPFIFSTAPTPFSAQALRSSIKYWSKVGPQRNLKLRNNSAFFLSKIRTKSRELGFSIPEGVLGPIIPIILGTNERALHVAHKLEERGYDIRAIRPPSVHQDSARLRLTLSSEHTEEELNKLIENLLSVLEKSQ